MLAVTNTPAPYWKFPFDTSESQFYWKGHALAYLLLRLAIWDAVIVNLSFSGIGVSN